MRRRPHVAMATLLLSFSLVCLGHAAGRDQAGPGAGNAPHPDIDVRTSLSQTALWLGNVVTFTVSLTCWPGVDILQEDLGADKLTLDGLQVVGHSVNRRITSDGRTHYDVVYGLTTFDPGAETLTIGDGVVRYTTSSVTQGGSQPARELHIPGAVLAWRSALPAALKSLEARNERAVDSAPRWWRATRQAGFALAAASMGAFGWILFTRVSAGRTRKPRRSIHRESARDLQATLSALREKDVRGVADRLEAYATLEAAVRRHVGSMTSLPGSALTPGECRERLAARAASLPADTIGRILDECQAARYQPVERLPGEDRFRASVEAAVDVFAPAR